MEAIVNLSTTKHLPLRTRLAAAACYCYEGGHNFAAAVRCAAHALEKVVELRRQESLDLPVPVEVTATLDAAERDLRVLNFKYAALSISAERREEKTAGTAA
ncbi:unnamed protein product, partial [Discosporangium mesarthrocarpum]